MVTKNIPRVVCGGEQRLHGDEVRWERRIVNKKWMAEAGGPRNRELAGNLQPQIGRREWRTKVLVREEREGKTSSR